LTQTSGATTTGDYTNTNTQSYSYSLSTGSNSITGTITANGVNPIAFNSGIQSSIQQPVNVQANVNSGTISK
jgi:hypothetical protein